MARFAAMRHIDSGTRGWTPTGCRSFSAKMAAKTRKRMEADLDKARTKDSCGRWRSSVERSTASPDHR